jgi:hypothetical protein
VITGLTDNFPPDEVERQVPDVASARAMLDARRPDVAELLSRRRSVYRDFYGEPAQSYLERAENATLVALARMGVRHGSFGNDYHDYHNEDHALEILDRRLGRILGQEGVDVLPGRDWLALSLFATCHDLRQRESVSFQHGIGNNEAASIAETFRILDMVGFERRTDEDLYLAMEVMIAGSTFDATPRPQAFNTAEVLATGGPLAPKLAGELDRVMPEWRGNPAMQRAVGLSLIASDLDTANVGERFPEFARSAARLAAEREMRSGRSLQSAESGQPVLGFLTDGQERYFFQLHRFCSELGLAVFAQGKDFNAPRVTALTARLRQEFGGRDAGSFTGHDVIGVHIDGADRL